MIVINYSINLLDISIKEMVLNSLETILVDFEFSIFSGIKNKKNEILLVSVAFKEVKEIEIVYNQFLAIKNIQFYVNVHYFDLVEEELEPYLKLQNQLGNVSFGLLEIERLLQKRKVRHLIIAEDIDKEYKKNLSNIINNYQYNFRITYSLLSKETLGKIFNSHKTGIVGICDSSGIVNL